MKAKSRYIVILGILFAYILLQFMWWEILLVKQTGRIIDGDQKLAELTSTDALKLQKDIEALHHRKKMQTIMIVGEGTVFLLLLLYGIYRIKRTLDQETRLNKQQNNFILSITHELKTPIAATKLQLQTLQKQKLDVLTQNELINNALQETERLNLLIDNVLLASSLDKGQVTFKLQKSDLGEEVMKVVNRYYKKELSNGVLIIRADPGTRVMLDTDAFPSVVTNLVGNAIKYTGHEKRIEVELIKKDARALLLVKDNGCGISEADKQNIFQRFFRAGNEETRNSKGTGLGLFIVKYILEGHQASIALRDNETKGSIFEIGFNVV